MAGPNIMQRGLMINLDLIRRAIRQQVATDSRPKSGWGGTGLEWRYDLGPINPKADQPVYQPERWVHTPHPKQRMQRNIARTARRVNYVQGAPVREGYRKKVGKSVTWTRPLPKDTLREA